MNKLKVPCTLLADKYNLQLHEDCFGLNLSHSKFWMFVVVLPFFAYYGLGLDKKKEPLHEVAIPNIH